MLYTFKAKKLSGEELAGEREAAHKRELAAFLRQEGYILIGAVEKDSTSAGGMHLPFSITALYPRIVRRISLAEKLIFTRNLSVMMRAGLPLTRALDTLLKQIKSPAFKEVISDVLQRIQKGESFSESVGKHPRAFPPLFAAMISAGELSGKLDESLDILTSQMKNEYELRRKVRGALVYPAVIVCVMILIGILMLIYVVPTLTSTFAQLNIELPASTRTVIAISNFLVNHGLLSASVFLACVYGVFLFWRTETAKRLFDIGIIRMPIIGTLAKEVNAARTARTMSSLLHSGVSILQTLTITRDVLQNHLFRNVLDEAQDAIQKGETMKEAFGRRPDLYPVLVSEMIAVGEETGKTAEMLEQLAEFYENEVAAATKDLSSIIEPFLMVIIGAVVGLFAVSMIQPLYTSIATGF